MLSKMYGIGERNKRERVRRLVSVDGRQLKERVGEKKEKKKKLKKKNQKEGRAGSR